VRRLRVLFVDDDPNILSGLRRTLRAERGNWEMEFVERAEQALERLAAESFDVVVSDMRMPGMDGAQLLANVRDLYPECTRIILSGHSDQEMILRSVGVAHQFLAKPCDPEELKEAIRRTEHVRRMVHREEIQRLVAKAQRLPSRPDLFTALMEELRNPKASLQRIGEIISSDPVMTAQILRIVNSAFFGLINDVSNPAQAVNLLGLSTVTSLVLTVHVFQEAAGDLLERVGLDFLWQHSLRCGIFARELATHEQLPGHLRDEIFTAGLLHDVGRLVLATNFPGEYEQLVHEAGDRSVTEAERESFGAGHPEVGAYLLGIWGLPNSIVEAVAWHDAPREAQRSGFSPVLAVHVANVFERMFFPRDEPFEAPRLDLDLLRELGLADRLEAWRDACRKKLGEHETPEPMESPA